MTVTPNKDPNFPRLMWHPESGERMTCHSSADVIEGWLDTHPNNVERTKVPSLTAKEGEMSREEVIAALGAGGIEFDETKSDKALAGQLRSAVKKALKDSAIPFDEKAGTRELLKLLPPVE